MRKAKYHPQPNDDGLGTLHVSRALPILCFALQISCQALSGQSAEFGVSTTATVASELETIQNISAKAPPRLSPTIRYELRPDLWRNIRNDFSLDHLTENKRVQQELRWLVRHPNYLPRLQPRMARFLSYIHQRVHARGMPGELALLPIVESALDPYAFSHGGAAGLWQFIPSTGRQFGLERDWWYDGRRDPVAATDAALDYLQKLYQRFGDWSLAIAAYNAGEGNVQRAQRRSPANATFWDLPLPRETRAYVPRLLAIAALVNEPGRYQVELPAVSPEVPFSIVRTDGQIDVAIAAEHLDVNLESLYHWNPALNQWATPPSGPHRLLVPGANKTADYQERLEAIPKNARVNWIRINVTDGDTLSQIAQRYNTDLVSLRKANKLQSNSIRSGQGLYIPKSSQALDLYPPSRGQHDATYTVRRGDSLWTIGKAHDVSVIKLMKANHVGPKDVLRVGQRLRIPNSTGKVIRTVHYAVRRGDSLAKIAARFNVQISDIADWNKLSVNNYLRPGQSLKLHVNVTAAD